MARLWKKKYCFVAKRLNRPKSPRHGTESRAVWLGQALASVTDGVRAVALPNIGSGGDSPADSPLNYFHLIAHMQKVLINTFYIQII